jgi:hypothetical protein
MFFVRSLMSVKMGVLFGRKQERRNVMELLTMNGFVLIVSLAQSILRL